MTPRRRRVIVAAALSLATLTVERASHADTPYVDPDRLRHFAVDGDVFALLNGEFAFDFQWLPVEHHAIVFSPYLLYYDSTVTVLAAGDTRTQTGFGGDVEYRVYSGTRGANGFYAGAGPVFGYTNATAGYSSSSGETFPAEHFTFVGGQIDGGVQAILDYGFLIGGGGGLQVTERLESGAKPSVGPRLTFTLGYAF